ncbi:MAG: hypothetical protein KIT18_01135 [Burkholderiales bacterium]|nr:hypothetical protein [Burkholderiales bacterium]
MDAALTAFGSVCFGLRGIGNLQELFLIHTHPRDPGMLAASLRAASYANYASALHQASHRS